MTAPSLPEFILARVREDEAEVDALLGEWGRLADGRRLECQCEAIRRIVDLYLILDVSNLTTENERAQHSTLRWVCREYASIWSDHPDFRAEWAA